VSLKACVAVLLLITPLGAHDDEPPAIARTEVTHGAAGPFAVAGYRMGEAALKALDLPRGSMAVEVIHHSPAEVQWSCIADGLQAATGASPGKLNLRWEQSTSGDTYSIVRNRKTGKTLRFKLAPSFVKSHLDLPMDKLESSGYAVVTMPAAEVFVMEQQ
jgi:formylmethanofuran dehydrogenase subunit E